jgi:vacuolar-type H+-ATPase subunit H
MKETDRSLLQQIREKELTINVRLSEVRKEAEEIIVSARKEAQKIVEDSEREGKEAAKEYYRLEMERVHREVEERKKEGGQQAVAVRVEGERNVQSATEKIIKAVLME